MFERQSKEQTLDKMMKWARAVSPKLTDFRRGSVIRTLFEAFAVAIEGLYDRAFRSAKKLIETNLYAVIGFDKAQAVPSSDTVIFGREEPSTEEIFIPAGTEVIAEPNEYRPPIIFHTAVDAVLPIGYTSVEVLVICNEAGAVSNVEAGTINTFVQKPFGLDTVTNPRAFINGKDEETPEDQKVRFQDYMDSNSRGTLPAIEYGAKTAKLVDSNGLVTEQVLQASATEDLVTKLGQVDLYVWNGVGAPSANLQTEIQKILRGYTDVNGSRVYGYKIAGTKVNIYPANVTYVKIKLKLTVAEWAIESDVKKMVEKEIQSFFYRLRLGQTIVHSELSALIKLVNGVYDIKVNLSVNNGTSYVMDNITVGATTIAVNNSIIYEV
jgi:uncharacterized phage protein gp47/JayE